MIDRTEDGDDLGQVLDRIRQVAPSVTPWNELFDLAKKNMLEKRNVLDSEDREDIKKALAILQEDRKVSTVKDLTEQLRYVVLKIGLKMSESPPSSIFISSDVFFVEIKLSTDPHLTESVSHATDAHLVQSVSVSHGRHDSQKSPSLLNCINDCDWSALRKSLNDLNRFYPQNCETHYRAQAFSSLRTVESDLISLTSKAAYLEEDVFNMVLNGSAGLIRPREGASPLRIYLFLSPYDLLDTKTRSALLPTSQEDSYSVILERDLAFYVELVVESHSELQLLPAKPCLESKSKKYCEFGELNASNGAKVPATLCLQLKQPILILNSLKDQLHDITNYPVESEESENGSNYMKEYLKKVEEDRRGSWHFTVPLPDQTHMFNVNDSSRVHLPCSVISRVLFNNPKHIHLILNILREQLLLNTVIDSCIRPALASSPPRPIFPLELTLPNPHLAEVVFEHPFNETLFCSARFEFDISTSKRSVVVKNLEAQTILDQESAVGCKVFFRSWSIPVTMRSIFKEMQKVAREAFPNSSDDQDLAMETDEPNNNNEFEEKCTNQAPISGRNLMPPVSGRNIWLGGTSDHCFKEHSVTDICQFMGKAWLPTSEEELFKVGLCLQPNYPTINKSFQVDNSSLPGKPSVNLLDLFKEIDKWEELKSSEPSPVKSPPPIFHNHMANPRLQDMLSTPAPAPQSMLPASSAGSGPQQRGSGRGGRHLSSSSSDTLGDLDMLCQLSKSLTSHTPCQTPTGDIPYRPPSMGVSPSVCDMGPPTPGSATSDRPVPSFERKRSIQDIIDSVVHEAGSNPGTPLGRDSPGSGTSGTPGGMGSACMSPASDNRQRSMFVGHSRSFDVDMMGHRPLMRERGLDEYDFEKTDPIQAGLVTTGRWSAGGSPGLLHSQMSMPSGPYSATLSSQPFPFQQPTSGPGSRGGKVRGGTGTRRRTRRANTANMGDRPASASGAPTRKPRGTSSNRRPRRQRGGFMAEPFTPGQFMSAEIPETAPSKVTLKLNINQLSSERNEYMCSTSDNVSTPPQIARARFNQAINAAVSMSPVPPAQSPSPAPSRTTPIPAIVKGESASPTVDLQSKTHGLDVEDSEDDHVLKETGEDALLRRNMLAIVAETDNVVPWTATTESNPSSIVPTEKAEHHELDRRSSSSSSTGNVFDNLASNKPITSDQTQARATKPNILSKGNSRKSSLEMVIGKLKLKDTGSTGTPLISQSPINETEQSRRLPRASDSFESVFGGELPEKSPCNPPAESVDSTEDFMRVPPKRKHSDILPGSAGPAVPSTPSGTSIFPFPNPSPKPIPMRQKSVEQPSKTKVVITLPKKRPSESTPLTDKDKFAALKEKVMKKKKASTMSKDKSSAPSAPKQARMDGGSSPEKKTTTIPGFPGSEGIMFSKSLKGFKIPKVVDDNPRVEEPPPPVPQKTPSKDRPHSRPHPRGPPELALQVNTQTRPPKSILKQSSTGPVAPQGPGNMPLLRPEIIMPSFSNRPLGRKTLLPIPAPAGHATPVLGSPFPNPSKPPGGIFPAKSPVRMSPFPPSLNMAPQFRIHESPSEPSMDNLKPEASTPRSPDEPSLIIDDSIKSPGTNLNISNQSFEMSPELSIVTDEPSQVAVTTA